MMTSRPGCLSLWLWVFWNFTGCVRGGEFVEPSPSSLALRSLAEAETRLPCRLRVEEGEQVVQVSWIRDRPDGTKEQIITAHRTEGHTEFGGYSGRVRFENSDPTVNSALIILNTEVSDEGQYTCHITTFPSGNFETKLSLTVWTRPISSLDAIVLVEGQPFRMAANCRSVARPPPGLSWDTDLPGQTQNRSSGTGVASSQFSLHPLRSMNGRKLDCLVWHPSQTAPLRLSNRLVVQFPPDAVITGYDKNWYVGLEGAVLRCESSSGNPKPQSFTWTRNGGALPEGVIMGNSSLWFDRPLSSTDEGVYECVATNAVGSGKADMKITVADKPQEDTAPLDNLMMIILGAVVGALVLILVIVVITVNRHHKRKNKQLSIELNEKREEISTLSRQASFRRVNSVSTDQRYQTDESIPLKVEGTLRTSLSSLERPRSRDSRSTLGGVGTVDFLGRPAIYNSSRRGRERVIEREGEKEASRMRVESYVRNSNISLEHHLHPPLHPSPFPMEHTAEIVTPLNGSAIIPAEGKPHSRGVSRNQHSPLSSSYPPLTDEEDEERGLEEEPRVLNGPREPDRGDNQDSETTSSQISEALSNHFQQSNGMLVPISRPNIILLPPQTSFIQKAQIV